jgi:hypothetical protein
MCVACRALSLRCPAKQPNLSFHAGIGAMDLSGDFP